MIDILVMIRNIQQEFLERKAEILGKQISCFAVDKRCENQRLVLSYKSGKLKGKASLFSYKELLEDSVQELTEIKTVDMEDSNQFTTTHEMLFVDSYFVCLLSKGAKSKEVMYYKRFSLNISQTTRNFISCQSIVTKESDMDEIRGTKGVYIKNSMIHLEGKVALFRCGLKLWRPCYLDGEKYYVRNASSNIVSSVAGNANNTTDSSSSLSSNIQSSNSEEQSEIEEVNYERTNTLQSMKEEFKYAYVNTNGAEPLSVCLCFPYVACLMSDSLDIYNLYWRESTTTKSTMQAKKVYSLLNNKDGTTIFADEHRFYVVTENSNAIRYLSPPNSDIQLKTLREELLSPQAHHLFKMRQDKNSEDFRKELMEFQFANGKANLERGRPKEAFRFFLESMKQSKYLSIEDRKDIREILRYFMYYSGSSHSQFSLISPSFFPSSISSEPIREKLTTNFKQGKIKAGIDQNFITQDMAMNFTEHFINLLIHKTFMYLMEFLEVVQSNPKYRPETLDQQAAVEYALLALYTLPHPNMASKEFDENNRRSLAYYHHSCYENIEKIVKRKHEPGFEKYTEQLFKVLTDTGCWRHAALLAHNLGQSTQQVMGIFKSNISRDIYYERYDGVDDVVDILSQMDGNTLLQNPSIREFISWIISLNPSKSVKIFTAPRANPPIPDLVLEFLNPFPLNMTVQYLHHIIYETKGQGITDRDLNRYHTEYAISLIDYVTLIYPVNLDKRLAPPAGTEQGDLGKFRGYLLKHIKESSRYNKEIVDKKLQTSNLNEEKISLFHVMGKHEEALTVLVKTDLKRAEEYCDTVFEEEQKSTVLLSKSGNQASNYNPYLIRLIEITTNPTLFDEYDEESALRRMMSVLSLLQRRASDINIIEVLSVLPEHSELRQLSTFLTQAIQFTHHNNRTTLIKNELARNASMQVKARHVKATTRSITVTSTTSCPVCEQPIGNAVFAIFPDQSVVHYRCLISNEDEKKEKNRNVHPKNGIDFKKFPVDF
ncbi:vacuolar protein sorting 39 [Naegleria gruberi]|uniref:Vacuolar protein sorting 39 n=1 Tax=Naegleria gruberi TaxID=5762 RepID=D2VUV3_NAEGR|nr:vacuolar protein sorting 39 [Naegleria gruberi]EFC39329.1 vacuolar protein sorting 39 [Naegleria gruberi]|eukprot:XP_002672073.1 vacuolar protein sorting 39 [Naegleria gruberi strain NEG-M]